MQFLISLQPTYWEQAFFNVPVEFEKHFGHDDENVRVELNGQQDASLTATINRRCNAPTCHPRLHFNAENRHPYQAWKQANGRLDDELSVEILGSNHIRLSIVSNKG